MRKLIISPQAGFGNRLRALCSGILLGVLTQREVYHYWVRDQAFSHFPHVNEMKTFDPSTLFDLQAPLYTGTAVDVCFSEWLPGDGWYKEQSTAQTKLRCGRVEKLHDPRVIIASSEKTILVETSREIHLPALLPFRRALMGEIYSRYFPLQPRWRSLLESMPVFDYGISVRRVDFTRYFPESDITTDEVASIVNALAGSKIIFSDDPVYATSLRKLLNAPLGVDAMGGDLYDIGNSLVEFLILSRCRHVYGTKDSTFSEQASIFGARPFTPIQRPK